MALHPGEYGYCPKHGGFEEYCCDCKDTIRVIYESKVTPLPALITEKCEMHYHMMPDGHCSCPPRKPPAMTVSEMREHLSRVDMLKEYLRIAVEARMKATELQADVVAILRSDFAEVADEIHATIKRLSDGDHQINDAEVERLMNYAKTGQKGNL